VCEILEIKVENLLESLKPLLALRYGSSFEELEYPAPLFGLPIPRLTISEDIQVVNSCAFDGQI
jgi:hypothetical protein